MRGQLGVRAFLPHPAPRNRLIDRVAGHRVHQHPQRHLIRPHHHTLAHEGRPCQSPGGKRSRHADPNKNYQVKGMINLSYVALSPGMGGR
jgi:hypothetical protein